MLLDIALLPQDGKQKAGGISSKYLLQGNDIVDTVIFEGTIIFAIDESIPTDRFTNKNLEQKSSNP